jgi:8-oxo-dGTP pyrophosphatase MutT (NUDIX family)
MVTLRASGRWGRGEVRARWVESSRVRVPQVEGVIERAWTEAMARPGIRLFDGPMCRLERWAVEDGVLCLDLSRTSYRIFLGTNLNGDECVRSYGREVLANPLGVSCALHTSDGQLLLGRRNERVAYYPSRIHPFAGSLEPSDELDVFKAIERELGEELGLGASDVVEAHCLGLVEDEALRQPELVIHVRVKRAAGELAKTVDESEHGGCVVVKGEEQAVARWLEDPLLTPVAVGTLLLWGRWRLSEQWYERLAGAHDAVS